MKGHGLPIGIYASAIIDFTQPKYKVTSLPHTNPTPIPMKQANLTRYSFKLHTFVINTQHSLWGTSQFKFEKHWLEMTLTWRITFYLAFWTYERQCYSDCFSTREARWEICWTHCLYTVVTSGVLRYNVFILLARRLMFHVGLLLWPCFFLNPLHAGKFVLNPKVFGSESALYYKYTGFLPLIINFLFVCNNTYMHY